MSDILDAKITQKLFVVESDIYDLVNNSDLNIKLEKLATKADLKANTYS